LKTADEDRINAFKMKALRQLSRVSWKKRKTNTWILQKADTDPHLLAEIKKRSPALIQTHNAEKWKLSGKKEIIRGMTPGQ